MGKTFDEKEQKWKPTKTLIGYDEKGKEVYEPAPLIVTPEQSRIILGFLKMHLNANTFLSSLKEEQINDIMFDVCQDLAVMWFRMGKEIKPEARVWIHTTIKDTILFALNRAGNMVTLNAMAKTQQSIEHIQSGMGGASGKQNKDFKVLGW